MDVCEDVNLKDWFRLQVLVFLEDFEKSKMLSRMALNIGLGGFLNAKHCPLRSLRSLRRERKGKTQRLKSRSTAALFYSPAGVI